MRRPLRASPLETSARPRKREPPPPPQPKVHSDPVLERLCASVVSHASEKLRDRIKEDGAARTAAAAAAAALLRPRLAKLDEPTRERAESAGQPAERSILTGIDTAAGRRAQSSEQKPRGIRIASKAGPTGGGGAGSVRAEDGVLAGSGRFELPPLETPAVGADLVAVYAPAAARCRRLMASQAWEAEGLVRSRVEEARFRVKLPWEELRVMVKAVNSDVALHHVRPTAASHSMPRAMRSKICLLYNLPR